MSTDRLVESGAINFEIRFFGDSGSSGWGSGLGSSTTRVLVLGKKDDTGDKGGEDEEEGKKGK